MYGPYAIRFMETEPAPDSTSSSMLDVRVTPGKSLDHHGSPRHKKDWINRVGKSLNTVLRTSHNTGGELFSCISSEVYSCISRRDFFL